MARPKGQTGAASTLTDKEFNRLLILVSSNKHAARNNCLLMFSFKLGLRAKEMAALKISDVINQDGTIKKTLRLIAAYTKGNKHRDISIENKAIIESLKAYLKFRQEMDGITFNIDSALFRSQKGSNFSNVSMARCITNIFIENGFEDCSSHSGRRSMITNLANNNIDLNSIRIIAGHSSITTTQRYIEVNPSRIADIMKNL
jgi:integrase/recombinase XerD